MYVYMYININILWCSKCRLIELDSKTRVEMAGNLNILNRIWFQTDSKLIRKSSDGRDLWWIYSSGFNVISRPSHPKVSSHPNRVRAIVICLTRFYCYHLIIIWWRLTSIFPRQIPTEWSAQQQQHSFLDHSFKFYGRPPGQMNH